MTETEWLACVEPLLMLEFLRDKTNARKANLFYCAMCRLNWHLFFSESSKNNVKVVELFVDGQATEEELRKASYMAESPTFGYDFTPGVLKPYLEPGEVPTDVRRLVEMGVLSEKDVYADEPAVDPEIRERLLAAADLAYHAGCGELEHPCLLRHLAWLGSQVAPVLRCIYGALFCPVLLDSSWLAWNNDTVAKLAQVIYADRAFDRLPILADALEDAGCTDPDILAHCRGPGPHVRGCWVVDLLTGRQ